MARVTEQRGIVLTEVETCMLRIALRAKADEMPSNTDAGPNKRDYQRLADLLDPLVKARIEQAGEGA